MGLITFTSVGIQRYMYTCIYLDTYFYTCKHSYILVGKWDNIDLDAAGAYGKASEQMTDYMFKKASEIALSPITK